MTDTGPTTPQWGQSATTGGVTVYIGDVPLDAEGNPIGGTAPTAQTVNPASTPSAGATAPGGVASAPVSAGGKLTDADVWGASPAAPVLAPVPGKLTDADVWPSAAPAPESPAMKAATAQTATVPGLERSIATGLTFGLEPDITAGSNYVSTAIGNALEHLQGKAPAYTPQEAFEASEQAERSAQGAYAQAHPVANALGNIGGGFLNPLTYAGGSFIGAAPTMAGAFGRGALVGAGTGAVQGFGSAGGDVANRVAGAENGALSGTLWGGALGAGGQRLGTLLQRPSSYSQAASALEGTGINPSLMPQATQTTLSDYLNAGKNSTDSAFKSVADTLPTPVPMSVGQMAGDPALQLTENAALRGGSGGPATITAQAFRDAQRRALGENIQGIGSELSGGVPVERGSGGVGVSNTLNTWRDAAAGGVNNAYEAARNAENPASLASHGSAGLATHLKYGLEDFDPLTVPHTMRQIGHIERVIGAAKNGLPTNAQLSAENLAEFPENVRNQIMQASKTGETPVKAIFDARARLSKLTRGNDPVEASAARRTIKQLDTAIDDAVTNGLMKGDPKTVDIWRQAIGQRKAFAKLFEGNDLIDKLTERAPRSGEHDALKIDPVSATNYILGREGIVGLGDLNRSRDLSRLGDVLGRDSAGWNALKGEVFNRLAEKGTGPSEGGVATFSGSKFASNWRDAQRKYGPVINQMFSPAERDLITRFAVTAERVTKPVMGGDNPSNSGVMVAKLLTKFRGLPFNLVRSIPFIDHLGDTLANATKNREIMRLMPNAEPRMASGAYPLSALAGTAAFAGAREKARPRALVGVQP